MERENERKIVEYRKAGIGYKKIAALLGISKNTVASFCKRNEMDQDKAGLVRYCKRCGKPFVLDRKHMNQVFCSRDCKYRWWNEQRKAAADSGMEGGGGNG